MNEQAIIDYTNMGTRPKKMKDLARQYVTTRDSSLLVDLTDQVTRYFRPILSSSNLPTTDAEDLAQEVIVALFEHLSEDETIADGGDLVAGIAQNIFREHYRGEKKRHQAETEYYFRQPQAKQEEAQAEVIRQQLDDVRSQLPAGDSQLITEYLEHGAGRGAAKAVADQRGLPARAVRSEINRVRETIASEFLAG